MRYNKACIAALISLVLIFLVVDPTPITQGQEDMPLLEPDEIGCEVLLNNRLTFNMSIMVELVYDGYVNIAGWSPELETFNMEMDLRMGPFLFRSHHDSRLGVIMAKENLTSHYKEVHSIDIDMDGWSLLIIVPGTYVMQDPYDYLNIKYRPDIDLDLESVDWSSAMGTELEWLLSIGLIEGLTNDEVQRIAELSDLGTMTNSKRVFFFPDDNEWMLYSQAGLPEGVMLTGGFFGDHYEFPDYVAPVVNEPKKFVITTGLLIMAASILMGLLIGSFFYQRINRAVKLNNNRRKLIYELVQNEPGIHFSAIMKELNLKPGVASYHINRLEKMELIKSFQDGMYRRFYLFEDRIEMKITLSDLQTMIINVVEDEPGISQVDISKMIGRSKVVINYHVRFLRDLGILILEKDGRSTHCFVTSQGSKFLS